MRLVIIDDSADVRNSLKRAFSQNTNIEIVGEAGSVREALQLINNKHPEVIVLDFQLPDGTALSVLQNYAPQPGRPVFIVLSTYPSHTCKKQVLNAGADYFFNKSDSIDDFFKLVGNLSSFN